VGGAGGLSETDMKRLRPLFVNVLAPLAKTQDAFMVDGGTDAGVMQLMGKARAEIGGVFPLIGVVADGTVTLHSIDYPSPNAGRLESHHTHFVLVPGTRWGDESPWLDLVVSKLEDESHSVTILVNGGKIARQDVANSLAAKRPVVVIAGTGRLADELAASPERSQLLYVVELNEKPDIITQVIADLLKEGIDG